MNLKARLQNDFGLSFPISGGLGNSLDQAIVVHKQTPNDYTSVEYGILRCLTLGRGVEWEFLEQSLLDHNGRSIDEIKIQTKQVTDTEIITQIEDFYFDISDCIDL